MTINSTTKVITAHAYELVLVENYLNNCVVASDRKNWKVNILKGPSVTLVEYRDKNNQKNCEKFSTF